MDVKKAVSGGGSVVPARRGLCSSSVRHKGLCLVAECAVPPGPAARPAF